MEYKTVRNCSILLTARESPHAGGGRAVISGLNVSLPDLDTCSGENGCDCVADDVTYEPPRVILWTSGEFVTCSAANGTIECNYPFFDTSDDMYHAIVAQGADPAYARITCTNDVAIVEHLALANGVRHSVATQRNYLSHANMDLLLY